MKTIYYFLLFCCLVFAVSCNTASVEPAAEEPESEEPAAEEPVTSCEPIQPAWDGKRPNDSYQYPVLPGMEEWGDLKSGQEMYDACQVPKDILENMSTQAIIQAILEHPQSFEIFVYSDCYQVYFERFWWEFNNHAYVELTERKDAAPALLDRLILTYPLTGIFSKPEFESQLLEILFSQTFFLSQLNDCEKKNVVEFALKNDDLRHTDDDFAKDSDYGLFIGKITASLLIGRTLIAAGYVPFVDAMDASEDLKGFIEGWQQGTLNPNTGKPYAFIYPSHPHIPPQIIDFGNEYLTSK